MTFSLVTMGYHVEELVDHLFFAHKTNDFYEMLLHHVATLTLYGGMILINITRFGAMIAWLHAIADVPGMVTKVFSHTNYKYPTLVSFLICIVTWGYTRNFMIPALLYCTANLHMPPAFAEYEAIYTIKKSLLFILCLMHVYWMALFFRILCEFKKSGSTEDT
jgi:sphingoid base N-palmitoyltransferase